MWPQTQCAPDTPVGIRHALAAAPLRAAALPDGGPSQSQTCRCHPARVSLVPRFRTHCAASCHVAWFHLAQYTCSEGGAPHQATPTIHTPETGGDDHEESLDYHRGESVDLGQCHRAARVRL